MTALPSKRARREYTTADPPSAARTALSNGAHASPGPRHGGPERTLAHSPSAADASVGSTTPHKLQRTLSASDRLSAFAFVPTPRSSPAGASAVASNQPRPSATLAEPPAAASHDSARRELRFSSGAAQQPVRDPVPPACVSSSVGLSRDSLRGPTSASPLVRASQSPAPAPTSAKASLPPIASTLSSQSALSPAPQPRAVPTAPVVTNLFASGQSRNGEQLLSGGGGGGSSSRGCAATPREPSSLSASRLSSGEQGRGIASVAMTSTPGGPARPSTPASAAGRPRSSGNDLARFAQGLRSGARPSLAAPVPSPSPASSSSTAIRTPSARHTRTTTGVPAEAITTTPVAQTRQVAALQSDGTTTAPVGGVDCVWTAHVDPVKKTPYYIHTPTGNTYVLLCGDAVSKFRQLLNLSVVVESERCRLRVLC